MKPVAFDYCRPDTTREAAGLLAELRADAAILAGGMTLGPMLNLRMVRPRAVIDITGIHDLGAIAVHDTHVTTGAIVVQAAALDSEILRREVPLLALALPWVGHFQTRNRGTLGGSIAHADPSAEIPLCLVALGGTLVLQSKRHQRRVPARDFFLGALTTARAPDELLVAIEWPRSAADVGHAFAEIAQRHGDFAIAAAACQVCLDAVGRLASVKLALGGVESRPVAIDTSALIGAGPERAGEFAEQTVRTLAAMQDHVASGDYRLALSRVLIERAIAAAAADARERQGRA
jgi:2-furoyl-CoA dehydrogenase FAD binding subunit